MQIDQAYIDKAVTANRPDEIHARYDILRKQCPIVWSNEYGGFWLLSRYADIQKCAQDSTTFISSVKAVVPSDPRGTRRPPLNFDAPRHTPYRTALDRTLKPARLKRLEAALTRHAKSELQLMITRGVGNICTEFGAMYSAWVETEWLNLDQEIAPVLAKTAAAWVNAWRLQDSQRVTQESSKLYDIARNLLLDRRQKPRDPGEDPATSLLLERDGNGEPLDDEHLIGALRQSLVVAMIAPSILLGQIANHLSLHKPLQQQLRTHPEDIPAAIEEYVRLYSPYRGFARTASTEIELHGNMIKEGQPITMTYAAANRDSDIFTDPHSFVLDRPNIAAHLGFGRGRHRCAGMPLARMALRIALQVLLESTSDWEVSGELEYARMPELGIVSCPLTFQL